jgi:hypothetical protein
VSVIAMVGCLVLYMQSVTAAHTLRCTSRVSGGSACLHMQKDGMFFSRAIIQIMIIISRFSV